MKKLLTVIVFLIIAVILIFIFERSSSVNDELLETMGNLVLKSSAFQNNDFIPRKYACEGENINPPLEIENALAEVKSLVLIMDDPDATIGVWDHWLLWNIEPETKYINEDDMPVSAVAGTNSFGDLKYGGPCPPAGKAHRYMFKLYALDKKLALTRGSVKSELEEAMEGHILAQAILIGLYERK